MRVVLDANVLVSGMLKPRGVAASVLRLILNASVSMVADERILMEYETVLSRPKFSVIKQDAEIVLKQVRILAERVVFKPIKAKIPDPDDLPFLEVARAAGADAIVTGNKRHFPLKACGGVKIFSPQELLNSLAESI